MGSLDDRNATNNAAVSTAMTLESADYQISATTFPAGGPTLGPFAGDFTLTNSGGADGAQAVSWDVYLSDDATFDAGDTLADTGTTTALAAGDSSSAIAFGGNWPTPPGTYYLIVAVAAADDIDGANNDATSSGIPVTLANRFVAVGDGGTVYYSDDLGASWTAVVSAAIGSTNLADVAYDTVNQRLVAVGDGGAAFLSDDAGATWSASLTGQTDDLSAITWGAYGGGRFVAVSETAATATNRAIYSDLGDSTTWSPSGTAPPYPPLDINYDTGAAGTFVAGANQGGNSAMNSTDGGAIWGAGTHPSEVNVVVYDTTVGQFVGFGDDYTGPPGTERGFYSGNGVAWNEVTLTGAATPATTTQDIAFDGGTDSVAVGDVGRIWYTSNGGGTWGLASVMPDAISYGVTYGAGTWVAVGAVGVGGDAWRSTNITDWAGVSAGASTLRGVVYVP